MLKESFKKNWAAPFLLEVIWHLFHPKEQREVWKDYRNTVERFKFFREAHFTEEPGKRVLVASLTSFLYQVKLEGMLALGLKMHGWQPIVLTSKVYTWPRRYFKAFGINDFVYWEELSLSFEDRNKVNRDAEKILMRDHTFKSVKQLRYEGSWVGPQILSSIARENHLGTPDVGNSKVKSQLTSAIPKVLASVFQSQSLLAKTKPKMILINEVNGNVMGPLTDLAVEKGINVIQFVQPSRDDAIIFKRITPESRRVHPNSLSLQGREFMDRMQWDEKMEEELQKEFQDRYVGRWFLQSRNQPGVKRKTKEEIFEVLKFDSAKKVAIVFSHILWDANLFYGDDLFEDYGEWFVETIRAAIRNDQVNWGIKLHPSNLWKRARDKIEGNLAEVSLIEEKIGRLPDHVRLIFPNSDINTISLFQSIDYGITVRGTIGLELPCFGVPTFTAGTGRYSGLGFTLDSKTREEYLERMAHIHQYGRMSEAAMLKAKRHAYGIFKFRPWTMKSFASSFHYRKSGSHMLDHNLTLVVNTLEECKNNGDLSRWARWAENLDLVDYLEGVDVGN